jgi:hypothetical protein
MNAIATSLRGNLELAALRASLQFLVQRHAALRTRFELHSGVPMQVVTPPEEYDLQVQDLGHLTNQVREQEIKRIIELLILEPVDVRHDPLFAMRLLRQGDDEHLLLIAMDHLVSDMYSLNILLEDLMATYAQVLQRRPPTLTPIATDLIDLANSQQNAPVSWIATHREYWIQYLMGAPRLKFPRIVGHEVSNPSEWAAVPLRIGPDLTASLRRWCRAKRTTLPLTIFAAYAVEVLRLCNSGGAVFQYQSDGRTSPSLERTVGFFSCALYLPIRVLKHESFTEFLGHVTQEYCRAYEHSDASFIAAQMPGSEFIRNSAFNWIPRASGTDLTILRGTRDSITCVPYPFDDPIRSHLRVDHEPSIVFFDMEEEIVGEMYFPQGWVMRQIIETLTRNLLDFLDRLVCDDIPARRWM